MKTLKNILFIFLFICSRNFESYAQSITTSQINGGLNTITTAVPFLLICPDSRAGGMGECGVASSPDVNSMHWNASKYAFAEKKLGIGVSYTPWLRQLVPDINLAYIAGYGKLDKNTAIGASMKYFSLGSITFTDIVGNTIGNYRPNEFSVDVALARKLGKNFSGAFAVRFINSNLTNGVVLSNGSSTKPGRALSVDLSGFYHNNKIELGGKKSDFNFGINLSNIGTKISYTDNPGPRSKDFIPINMRLGASLKINIDDYNSFAMMADVNKLLVPTPPEYEIDPATNTTKLDKDGNPVIAKGKDPYRSVASGIFGSFNDAPGGFNEEIKEFIWQLGIEYWYAKQFGVRAGYFHEDRTKGNRKFFTLGAGVRYSVFGLDFAYLIPTVQRHPLQNTLRFTLTFDFDAFKKQNDESKNAETK